MELLIVLGGSAAALIAGAGYYWQKSKKPEKSSAFDELLEKKKQSTTSSLPEGTENIEFGGKIIVPPVPAEPAGLSTMLAPTKRAFSDKLKSIFGVSNNLEKFPFDEIEEALYTSDLGPTTVQRLLESLQSQLSKKQMYNFETLRDAIRAEIKAIVGSVNSDTDIDAPKLSLEKRNGPIVWLVVGVNGAGKTTTIGKLAGWACKQKLKVMVAAGDTFRAAAGSQLAVWSERAQVEIFEGQANAKPSGVAFDACQKAVKDNFDLLIVDTAGRLHTQANLMEELAKIKRVIEKATPGAPHETLLVLDANNGQNALVQAKQFHEALTVSGVILTKLDGTAKGGVVVGLAHELKLPVKAIGVGEKMGDLRGFSASEFVDSLI